MTLYDLTDEYMELLQMAEDQELDQETIADTLEAVGGELEDKAESYAKVIRNLKADAEALRAEEIRFRDRRATVENNIGAMTAALEGAMIQTGKTKFKTKLFSFGIQKNAPSLDVIDEDAVPDEFWIAQEPKLDRRAALDYIKANGDQVWGRKRQTESLRIR